MPDLPPPAIPCAPGRRCRAWRTCPHCAAARQARVADLAVRLLGDCDDVRLYTLRPTRPGAAPLRLLHRAWLRGSTAPAGLWSIEGSADGPALHLHALAPMQAVPRLRHCHVYRSDPVQHLRAAAAYMVKPGSAPHPADYDGRLWGTYGPLSYWLLHESAAPLVRGAAAEHLLSGSPSMPSPHVPQDHRVHYSWYKPAATDPPVELSDEEYAASARRHLPTLYTIAGDKDFIP